MCAPYLPVDRPRYVMGLGHPDQMERWERHQAGEPDVFEREDQTVDAPRARFARPPPVPPRDPNVVRGLMYCDAANCCDPGHRLVDRDVNACRNILCAFLARVHGEPRPAYLSRGNHAPPPPAGPRRQYRLR